MKVIVAKSAGFCFGVDRAYKMVQQAIQNKKESEKVSTFGPLIHNNRVINQLESQNVNVLKDAAQAESTVIIRSHGISDKQKKVLEQHSKQLLDATCPFVTKVHIVSQNFQKQGIQVVIVGDPKHAEMQGIIEDLDNPICVQIPEEAAVLHHFSKLGVVCQTTLRKELFEKVCRVLETKCDEIIIDDTICLATTDRQTAVRELAQQVDAVIVVGGSQSSNTKKLSEIASEFCPTQKVESVDEIDIVALQGKKVVGVSAGASTPQWQIDEVVEFLESIE
jgi:4-hydroxy-3-methylbut-2-enyl diphosphate reductase